MLAQVYYETQSSEVDPFASLLFLAIMLAVSVFYLACLWRIFTKAGEPGWHAVVPILNTYTLIKVAGRPGWWLLLTFVPCIGLLVMVIVYLDLAAQFGKGSGFGIGLVFLSPIFLPILAFGRSQHGASWRPASASFAAAPPFRYPAVTTQPALPVLPALPAVPGDPARPALPPPVAQAPVTPAAGWYVDPTDSAILRWWDGSTWTEHTRPGPSV